MFPIKGRGLPPDGENGEDNENLVDPELPFGVAPITLYPAGTDIWAPPAKIVVVPFRYIVVPTKPSYIVVVFG
jgi:hypothetical protein